VPPGLRRLSAIVVLAAVGCSASVSTQTPAATITLHAYVSPTGTATPTQAAQTPAPEETVRPTSTPFTHTIQKDETLLAIAARYGISLETLLAANPGINPRLLSIGQTIIIPGPEGGQLIPDLATTTPIPVQVSQPKCYPSAARELVCLASVSNPGEEPIEGVVVRFRLSAEDAQPGVTVDAYTPLNLLLPGRLLPVSASFSMPAKGIYSIDTTLLSALPAANLADRYADVAFTEDEHSNSQAKTSSSLTGTLNVAAPAGAEVRRLVVLAMGFDAGGQIVGFAESEIDPGSALGSSIPYDLTVFSLGPPIEDVQVVAEASIAD
jgi:LysM repeat protein